jgi:hypothetical protein
VNILQNVEHFLLYMSHCFVPALVILVYSIRSPLFGRLQVSCNIYLLGVKGKVVPVLNLIKHYAMKAYGGVDV